MPDQRQGRNGGAARPSNSKRQTDHSLMGRHQSWNYRRKYKKTIKKAGKYQPTGAETPAELEERNELSGDGMRRLHDGYEKARYSREGCTKEEAEALRN